MGRPFHEFLGRKPAKFNIGQAIGVAMQNAGQYFGTVAIEKKNAEALAEARDYDEKRVADQREYNEEQEADRRAYEREQADLDYVRQVTHEATINERERQERLAEQAASDSQIKRVISVKQEDGSIHQVGIDADGNEVKDFGSDPDIVELPDGTFGRMSAGAAGSTQKRTEGQTKLLFHGRNLDGALGRMKAIVGNGDGTDGGYDLRSWEAMGNQILQTFGSYGNWLTTNEGQLYQNTVTRAAESLFKGESGAAGSDQEAARYRSMFPAPGDRPEVIQQKLEMMDAAAQAFKDAANEGMNIDDSAAMAREAADQAAFERGMFITDDGLMQREAGQPMGFTAQDLGIPDADIRWVYPSGAN